MEQQKGGSNDTDSRTSNSTSRDLESSGFSAAADEALSNSIFSDSRDAPFGIPSDIREEFHHQSQIMNNPLGPYCDTLWTQASQLQATNKMIMQGLLQAERSQRETMPRGNFSGTHILPQEQIITGSDSIFQFSSGQGPFQATKPTQQWRKCDDLDLDYHTGSLPASARVVSPKILDMQDVPVQIGSSSGIHVGLNVDDAEASPPAEKRLRSMMSLNDGQMRAPGGGKLADPAGTIPSFHNEALMERFGVVDKTSVVMGSVSALPPFERQQWISSEETARPIQVRPLAVRGLGSFGGTRELNTMEQLLVQCASALEANDVSYAQQIIMVINNISSFDGDPNQRLLAYFMRALILRASRFTPHLLSGHEGPLKCSKLKTALDLTNYVDVMPWYRFGFIAANGAILEAFEGKDRVHILDFNTSHCMQWPTLIEALAERSEGPPQVRLTVCISKSPVPPQLEVSYDDLIIKLAKFARLKNVPFEYQLLSQDCENLEPSMIGLRDGEVLAVNCLFRLHYVADDCMEPSLSLSPRDEVLRFIRNLNPAILTVTEDDANLTSPKLVARLKAAFNYLWIPFDALHTLLPKESEQRVHYEGEVANKIENIIACEGRQRIERVETKDRWVQRMKRARFEMISFSEDVITENKLMLGEHSGCWGLRKDEDEEVLFLTWKGHNVSFSTVWVPVDPPSLPL